MNEKPVVLVLEDSSNWQTTVKLLLETGLGRGDECPVEIVTARSLDRAKEILRSRIIDVAIVDICLEEGDITNTDGMTLLEELSRYYPEDHTHAVVLSGHGTVPLVVESMKHPYVVDYMEKDPGRFDGEKFVSAVRKALRNTASQRDSDETIRIRVVPSSFLQSLGLDEMVSTLISGVIESSARKDLELLLKNLLFRVWPLLPESKMGFEQVEAGRYLSHVLFWSRKLASAVDVVVGAKGTMDVMRDSTYWQEDVSSDRVYEWSTRYFDGSVFELPDVSFEQFSTLASGED